MARRTEATNQGDLSPVQVALVEATRRAGGASFSSASGWRRGRQIHAPIFVYVNGADRAFNFATLRALLRRGVLKRTDDGTIGIGRVVVADGY